MSKTKHLQDATILAPIAYGMNAVYDVVERTSGPKPYTAPRKRKETKKKIIEIRQSGMTPISTGTDDPVEADKIFQLWRARNHIEASDLIAPHSVMIADVAEETIAMKKPPEKVGGQRKATYQRYKNALEWFAVYCAGKTLYDVTQEVVDGYIDSLCGDTKVDVWGRQLPARPEGCVRRLTAEQYARHVLRVIRNRKVPPGAWPWQTNLKVSNSYVPRVTLLTPTDLARLLWSCWRGWVWDAQNRRWKTEVVVDPKTGESVERRVRSGWTQDPETGRWSPDQVNGRSFDGKRDVSAAGRKALARYILFYVSTGTRCQTIRVLRWSRNSEVGWLSVSPTGTVTLHRRGDGVKDGKTKKRHSTQLPARFAAHVRRWARMADPKPGDPEHWRRCEWAVPNQEGGPLGSPSYPFKRAVIMAGLDPKFVTPHTLKHTCVTWAIENGWTRHRIARMIGMTEVVLELVYAQFIEEFQSVGGVMPASIRGNRTLH